MLHKATYLHFIKPLWISQSSQCICQSIRATSCTHCFSLLLTFPQHAISSPQHISCVICLFSPSNAKKEAFVFLWSGWRGWCLSFLRCCEKAVILHERKATSVTSGVTLTDRVQSGRANYAAVGSKSHQDWQRLWCRVKQSGFEFSQRMCRSNGAAPDLAMKSDETWL